MTLELDPGSYTSRRLLSLVYLELGRYDEALGDADGAFRWLEHAFALGADSKGTLNTDPNVDQLCGDPRFAALLKRLRLAP